MGMGGKGRAADWPDMADMRGSNAYGIRVKCYKNGSDLSVNDPHGGSVLRCAGMPCGRAGYIAPATLMPIPASRRHGAPASH